MTSTAADPYLRVDPRTTRRRRARPAVVLTDKERRNDTAIVSPITSNKGPTKGLLPDGLKARGAVLPDQVRTLDRSARGFRAVDRVPQGILNDVRGRLAALRGINVIAISREPVGVQIEE